MSPQEFARIRHAARERGRKERREQGIPVGIKSAELTAKLAALLAGAK